MQTTQELIFVNINKAKSLAKTNQEFADLYGFDAKDWKGHIEDFKNGYLDSDLVSVDRGIHQTPNRTLYPQRKGEYGDINGYIFEKMGNFIVFHCPQWYATERKKAENILRLFFSDDFEEKFEPVNPNTWKEWEKVENGVAFRDGIGDGYVLWKLKD